MRYELRVGSVFMSRMVRERGGFLIPQWRYMAGVDVSLEKYLHGEMEAGAVFRIVGGKENKP